MVRVRGRGRGESGDAVEYELERAFEDLTAVVESIDEPVTLIGHSFGAICGLEVSPRTDNLHQLVRYEPPIAVGANEHPAGERLVELAALIAAGENRVRQVFVPTPKSPPCGRPLRPRLRRCRTESAEFAE